MPIRFTCPHCNQLLSVARRKIGRAVACPKCLAAVRVPPPLPKEAALPQADMRPSSVHPDASLEGEHEARPPKAATAPASATSPPESSITFPRSVLYFVGGLIVAVAILAFLIGLSMGRFSWGEQAGRNKNTPYKVTGRLTYETAAGSLVGDSEAVIVIVPVGREPDEKLNIAPLRTDAPPPDPQHPTLVGIRSVGGDFARARPSGEFAVEVQGAGEYFVLLLSSHARRTDNQSPTTMEIAQIARYFTPADVLLGANAYRWSREFIRDDTSLDYSFVGR